MPLSQTLFELGAVSTLPEAAAALERSSEDPAHYLVRHAAGDWGDVTPEEQAANILALGIGGELFSSYEMESGLKLGIMTAANRQATYLFLPRESEPEKEEASSKCLESLSTAIGFALGELLVHTGNCERLTECLDRIKTVASATFISESLGSDDSRLRVRRSLQSAALQLVRTWQEGGVDLTGFAGAVEELRAVLEVMGLLSSR